MSANSRNISRATIAVVGTATLCTAFIVILYAINTLLLVTAPLTKAQSIQRDQTHSKEAFAAMTPQVILLREQRRGLTDLRGFETVPLGGVANSRTVFCREAGELIHYQSDRYGFRNDDSVWDQPITIAAVGDSYVQGACVEEDVHMVGRLREHFGNVINLGSFGNGPLANLGVIKEYLADLSPKIVLWFYVPNDMAIDLPLEQGNRVLKRYLNPGFTQQLKDRQGEVDKLLKDFLQEELIRQLKDDERKSTWHRWVTLKNLRDGLQGCLQRWLRPPPPTKPAVYDDDRQHAIDYDLHAIAVAEAAAAVAQTGGKLIFVVVPNARMYRPTEGNSNPATHVAKLKNSITKLGVPVIDIYDPLSKKSNPMEYYVPMPGHYGHFNHQGYGFAAEVIRAELARDWTPAIATAYGH